MGGETISTLPTGTKYMVLDAGGNYILSAKFETK